MANNGTQITETNCQLHALERNRYFYGKLLTTRDFEAEQRYFMAKDRLINRLIHGVGIVCGLQVEEVELEDSALKITLAEGVALDCCGQEIVVSRSSRVEAKGTYQEGQKNYLYLKYAECQKEPVPVLANASTCEETCCYSRIQETYEVLVSPDPPVVTNATFTGTVGRPGPKPIWGAKVEALQEGRVQAATFTDETGAYTLAVMAGQYDLRASASGFQAHTEAGQNVLAGDTTTVNFTLTPATEKPEAASLCNELSQQYYAEHLQVCPECKDPKVLLAVVDIPPEGGGDPSIDQSATEQYRTIVYNNPMLHHLLCDHLTDFNNPHYTSAEQIEALQSINSVGNVGGQPYVSNIDLVSNDNTIGITPDPLNDNQKIDLKLATDAVERKHLNADVINNLLGSDGTVTIAPDPANKTITISTTPAQTVTSVGPALVVGTSQNFAREDHVHDLANHLIERKHLHADVINNLLDSDGTVTIKPDPTTKTINISTTPAKTVTSVGPVKVVGTSQSFAREDHVHNLRINNQGPDKNGDFLLTPGANVTITPGAQPHELIIAATGAAARIFTGEVEVQFDGNGNLIPVLLAVDELKEEEPFAVMLAPQLPPEKFPPAFLPHLKPQLGAHFIFGSALEFQRLFVAFVPQPYNKTFEIHGFAPQLSGQKILMVYWVIAGAQQVKALPIIRDSIIDFIRNNPNITLARLTEGLAVERAILQPELDQLMAEGIIRRDPRGRFTLVQP
jgi:hypothetical protein